MGKGFSGFVLFKRFAHSAEPRHLGCSVVDLLGLCLCAGLWVCVFLFFFVRGSSCLGLLVYLLARSGAILGSIFGLWGCLGLCFEGSGGPVGGFGGPWGPLWPPRRPKVKFSHFFPSHFEVILASFWSSKSMQNLMSFLVGFSIDFLSMFG